MARKPVLHPRNYRIAVYLTKDEQDQVAELAEKTGTDLSTAVRMMIKMSVDQMTIATRKDTDTGE